MSTLLERLPSHSILFLLLDQQLHMILSYRISYLTLPVPALVPDGRNYFSLIFHLQYTMRLHESVQWSSVRQTKDWTMANWCIKNKKRSHKVIRGEAEELVSICWKLRKKNLFSCLTCCSSIFFTNVFTEQWILTRHYSRNKEYPALQNSNEYSCPK